MTVSIDKKYVTRDGEWDAKVIHIYDSGYKPVLVSALHIKDAYSIKTFWTHLNGKVRYNSQNGSDLIEVPEATQDGWIEFDAENDEVPFLHMHDMIEVRYEDCPNTETRLAGSVYWDNFFEHDPVVAYRLVKKAEVKG